MDEREIRELSIDTIRALAMDSVQQANAGHPGTAMALAPLAYTIFERFLRANPQDTQWPDRDRFVLSSGHASGARARPGTPSAGTRPASR
jgi:transketolase